MLVLWVAVRVPLQSGLAVGRLNFVNRGRLRDAEHFIKIALVRLRHSFSSFLEYWLPHKSSRFSLIDICFRCGGGTHGYTHHRGAQHTSMEDVAGLKNLQHGTVLVFGGLGAVHCLMQMRIKLLSCRIHTFRAKLCNVVKELLVNKLEPAAVILIFGFAVRRESLLKSVNGRNQGLEQT